MSLLLLFGGAPAGPVEVFGAAVGTLPGWSGTAAGLVDHKAVISTTFAGWSGTSTATVDNPASTSTTWGGWTGTATGTVEHPAIITATWPGWSGTAFIPDTSTTSPSGGLKNSSPWLSFKDDGPQRTRRQLDDEEVLLLVCI